MNTRYLSCCLNKYNVRKAFVFSISSGTEKIRLIIFSPEDELKHKKLTDPVRGAADKSDEIPISVGRMAAVN